MIYCYDADIDDDDDYDDYDDVDYDDEDDYDDDDDYDDEDHLEEYFAAYSTPVSLWVHFLTVAKSPLRKKHLIF